MFNSQTTPKKRIIKLVHHALLSTTHLTQNRRAMMFLQVTL